MKKFFQSTYFSLFPLVMCAGNTDVQHASIVPQSKIESVGTSSLSVSSKNNTITQEKPLKILVVNGYEVASNSKPGQQIKNDFLKAKAAAEQELKTQQKALIDESNQLQAKLATLNEDAQKAAQKKLATMDRDLKERAEELKANLETDMYKKTEQLGKQFEETVKEYAQKQNADIVVDEATGKIVWAVPAIKCTDDIVTAMNLSYEKNATLENKDKAIIAKNQSSSTAAQKKS